MDVRICAVKLFDAYIIPTLVVDRANWTLTYNTLVESRLYEVFRCAIPGDPEIENRVPIVEVGPQPLGPRRALCHPYIIGRGSSVYKEQILLQVILRWLHPSQTQRVVLNHDVKSFPPQMWFWDSLQQ